MADRYDASWLNDVEAAIAPPEDDGCPPPLPDEAYSDEAMGNVMQFPDGGRLTAEQAPARTSQWRCAADLEGLPVPEREWLVPDLIPAQNVTLLYGDGGTGKSLLALQLAVAVALGRSWLGQPVMAGKALFPSAEDEEAELHRRLVDIVRNEGTSLSKLDDLSIRSLAGEDAMLARLAGTTGPLVATELYREVDALLEAERPALLVLDTLADIFPGNENDKAQARQFVGLLTGLALRHHCAVVMLAHPSVSGMNSRTGTSGNVAWSASVRSRLYFERVMQGVQEADPDARVLRTMKANYGPKGGEISVTWRDGVFVANATQTGLDRLAVSAKAERVFLGLLRTFTDQGRPLNSAGGTNYAPRKFADHPASEGITKRAFQTAMEILLAQGRIVNRRKGPPSRSTTYIAEADL